MLHSFHREYVKYARRWRLERSYSLLFYASFSSSSCRNFSFIFEGNKHYATRLRGDFSTTPSFSRNISIQVDTSACSKQAEPSGMLKQYQRIKERYSNFMILFQVGDFYEIYYEHAKVASEILGILLTQRRTKKKSKVDDDENVPMAGIPVRSLPVYLPRLIRQNICVALCDQIKKPDYSTSSSTSLMDRKVVRLVTPGTLLEEDILVPDRNNYLMAVFSHENKLYGVAHMDVSTGEWSCDRLLSRQQVKDTFANISPAEVLVLSSSSCSSQQNHIQDMKDLIKETGKGNSSVCWSAFTRDISDSALTDNDDSDSDAKNRLWSFLCERTSEKNAHGHSKSAEIEEKTFELLLRSLYQNISTTNKKDVFLSSTRSFSNIEKKAILMLFTYVVYTQCGKKPRLGKYLGSSDAHMALDKDTRRSLEISKPIFENQEHTLLHAINKTVTNQGSRLLCKRLHAPFKAIVTIKKCQNNVETLVNNLALLRQVRHHLRSCCDMERAYARLYLNRANLRDLIAIKHSLIQLNKIIALIVGECKSDVSERLLSQSLGKLEALLNVNQSVIDRLNESLVDDVSVVSYEQDYIKQGYCSHLDEIRRLRDRGDEEMQTLEVKYKQHTGSRSLAVKKVQPFGLCIVIKRQDVQKLENQDLYFEIREGALRGSLRFSTKELVSLDARIKAAREQNEERQGEILQELTQFLREKNDSMRKSCELIAKIDLEACFAHIAIEKNFVKPEIIQGSETEQVFEIKNGRHPVVENSLHQHSKAQFVPNDCYLHGKSKVWVIAGPNMGGKSTFLRQNALIGILAQCGSYVPAESARLSIIDRIFCRVGAADDIAGSRSTFMVEMEETAGILHHATYNSLVIMDEVGRGTSHQDGIALAESILDHLYHINACRVLFATHYGVELWENMDRSIYHGVDFYYPKTLCSQNGLVFSYDIRRVEKACDPDKARKLMGSHGTYIASLAGLPDRVVYRAREIIERNRQGRKGEL